MKDSFLLVPIEWLAEFISELDPRGKEIVEEYKKTYQKRYVGENLVDITWGVPRSGSWIVVTEDTITFYNDAGIASIVASIKRFKAYQMLDRLMLASKKKVLRDEFIESRKNKNDSAAECKEIMSRIDVILKKHGFTKPMTGTIGEWESFYSLGLTAQPFWRIIVDIQNEFKIQLTDPSISSFKSIVDSIHKMQKEEENGLPSNKE
jgi:hypothetical protein